ncbi:hypothetical protein, partial [Staphylococcus pasteuri]|uniref:hypothetical protein n=1 Tax=Staphylococcus pasteuri TaxID=45972 RepID=UPI001649BAE6
PLYQTPSIPKLSQPKLDTFSPTKHLLHQQPPNRLPKSLPQQDHLLITHTTFRHPHHSLLPTPLTTKHILNVPSKT